MHRNIWFFVLTMLILIISSLSHAAEVNKRTRLGPEAQTKVNRALAKSYVADLGIKTPKSSTDGVQNGCGNTEIGTLTNARGSRIENVTVVRGDVITVSRNTKCQ